jgi:hypothetical protein
MVALGVHTGFSDIFYTIMVLSHGYSITDIGIYRGIIIES